MPKILHIKVNGDPVIKEEKEEEEKLGIFEECLSISPDHCVFYNRNVTEYFFNTYLSRFKGTVMANLKGDVQIIKCDKDGNDCDIDENILEILPKLIEDDKIRRKQYLDEVSKQKNSFVIFK